MNDWNGNGNYDAMDSYIDYRLSGGDKYSGHGRKKNCGTGCGVLIYIFFMIVFYGGVAGSGITDAGWFDMVDF